METLLAAMFDFASLLPHARSPWPQSIGPGFPFTVSGAFGVLSTVSRPRGGERERAMAAHRSGVWGFRLGAFFYLVALTAQVLSGR